MLGAVLPARVRRILCHTCTWWPHPRLPACRCRAGALAAGVPFQWLPAPLVAACGIALFYESRSLREYIVFVLGAFVTGG